jgi:hypothetical protein
MDGQEESSSAEVNKVVELNLSKCSGFGIFPDILLSPCEHLNTDGERK